MSAFRGLPKALLPILENIYIYINAFILFSFMLYMTLFYRNCAICLIPSDNFVLWLFVQLDLKVGVFLTEVLITFPFVLHWHNQLRVLLLEYPDVLSANKNSLITSFNLQFIFHLTFSIFTF